MRKISKIIVVTIFLLSLSNLTRAEVSKVLTPSPPERRMICLCVDGYNDPWRHAKGTPYPAPEIFDAFKKSGITDVAWQLERLRGKEVYFPTSLKSFKYNPQLAGRDWLEETLTEADKHGMKVWLMINPAYHNPLTNLKGLKAQTKNYVDLINEIGKKYKSRHKSLAGIYHHETHAAESPDFHEGELEEFSKFCDERFGERYTGKAMPDGQGKDKWNNRFFIYKAHCLNEFAKALNTAAKTYGMKSIYCYYPIESRSNSLAGGVDIGEIEDYSNGIWAVGNYGFFNFDDTFHDIALSYRGINVPQNLVRSFHGRPISIFEAQFQLFPKVSRESKRKRPSWTKRYGDLYDFFMRSEKTIDLFQGVANTKKWLDARSFWLGGKDQARVAFVLSSFSFTMRHRPVAGISWKKYYAEPLAELRKSFPVSTVLIDKNFFEDPKNLRAYELLVVPEAMGLCASQKAVESLKRYLVEGGKVLAIRTGVSSSLKDLTQEKDFTHEIFGVNLKKTKSLAGYHKLGSGSFKVPSKKIWGKLSSITPTDAEILVKDRFSDKPVLTRKGNAWFLALSPDDTELLATLVAQLAPPVVKLEDNTGFTIPAVVKKHDTLCVPLACDETATARLVVDTAKASLPGEELQVRNIVTGNVVADTDSRGLLKGIDVKTIYKSEPLILAVGPEKETGKFKGLVPNAKDFEGIRYEAALLENPEVAISVPDKPGIKVGVYQNAYGSMGIYDALQGHKDFNVFFLPRLDSECMGNAQVIIIPQARNGLFIKQGAKMIRDMVEKHGKGLLLTHRSAMNAAIIFPKLKITPLGQYLRMKNNYLKIVGNHPANGGIKENTTFIPGFAFDHFAFNVDGFDILAVDNAGRSSICVGRTGKGRIALFGSLPGWFGNWDDAPGHDKGKLEGVELEQLIKVIKWLSE